MRITEMYPSERAWVASSWLRSYEHAELNHLARPSYWRHFGGLVDSLLDSCTTLVARNPKDETQALGFVCRDQTSPTLHYIYAKWLMRDRRGDARPLGLAGRMLGEAGLISPIGPLRVSFHTVAWMKYAAKHGLVYEHDRQLVSVTRAQARRAPREMTP